MAGSGSRKSFREQLKASWLTSLFSCVLFAAVSYFLFWNETGAIGTHRSLAETKEGVVSIDARTESALRDYDGKLVHLFGPIDVLEPLTEPDYNIRVLAVKLRKRVQMYQWVEEDGGSDSSGDPALDFDVPTNKYAYYRDWRDYLVDSDKFYIRSGHANPRDMPASSRTLIAENVKIGRVRLGVHAKRKFSDYWEITSDERPDRQDIKLHSGAYYHGADPLVHETGDLRVTFSYAGRQNDVYSAVGLLEEGTLRPYVVKSSDEPFVLLRKGKFSAFDMIDSEHREMNAVAWRYRLVGWFQMFAATMSLHPDWFALLVDSERVSPRLGRRSRLGTNIILSTCLTLFVISFAWISYRPLLSLTLFLIALCPFFYFSKSFPYDRIDSDEHLH